MFAIDSKGQRQQQLPQGAPHTLSHIPSTAQHRCQGWRRGGAHWSGMLTSTAIDACIQTGWGGGGGSKGGRSSDAGVKGPFYACSTASGCVSTLGLPELLGAEVAGNTYPVTKLKVYPLL